MTVFDEYTQSVKELELIGLKLRCWCACIRCLLDLPFIGLCKRGKEWEKNSQEFKIANVRCNSLDLACLKHLAKERECLLKKGKEIEALKKEEAKLVAELKELRKKKKK